MIFAPLFCFSFWHILSIIISWFFFLILFDIKIIIKRECAKRDKKYVKIIFLGRVVTRLTSSWSLRSIVLSPLVETSILATTFDKEILYPLQKWWNFLPPFFWKLQLRTYFTKSFTYYYILQKHDMMWSWSWIALCNWFVETQNP